MFDRRKSMMAIPFIVAIVLIANSPTIKGETYSPADSESEHILEIKDVSIDSLLSFKSLWPVLIESERKGLIDRLLMRYSTDVQYDRLVRSEPPMIEELMLSLEARVAATSARIAICSRSFASGTSTAW